METTLNRPTDNFRRDLPGRSNRSSARYDDRVEVMAGALRGVWSLIRDSGRVLIGVGPALLALFLLGATVRASVLWLAVIASGVWPFLGALLVPLAPLATLLSLVLMLRLAGRLLPAFQGPDITPPAIRLRGDLTSAALVLLPFLAVYASQGMLKQDVTVYIRDVTATEAASFLDANYARAVYDLNWIVISIIVVALVARNLIKRKELVAKHWSWALIAAYLEALWLVTLAQVVSAQLKGITDWVMGRQVVAATIDAWSGWVDTLGAIASTVRAVPAFIGQLIGMVGTVITMPVAWLAVGALVFGRKLVGPKPDELTPEAIAKRTKAIPHPVRRGVEAVLQPVTSPVKNTWIAVKKVAIAGIGTMVLFCIAFYLAVQAQVLVRLGLRAVLGPQPWDLQFVLEPWLQLAENATYWVLIVVLLVAAVNAVALAQSAAAPQRAQGTANSTS